MPRAAVDRSDAEYPERDEQCLAGHRRGIEHEPTRPSSAAVGAHRFTQCRWNSSLRRGKFLQRLDGSHLGCEPSPRTCPAPWTFFASAVSDANRSSHWPWHAARGDRQSRMCRGRRVDRFKHPRLHDLAQTQCVRRHSDGPLPGALAHAWIRGNGHEYFPVPTDHCHGAQPALLHRRALAQRETRIDGAPSPVGVASFTLTFRANSRPDVRRDLSTHSVAGVRRGGTHPICGVAHAWSHAAPQTRPTPRFKPARGNPTRRCDGALAPCAGAGIRRSTMDFTVQPRLFRGSSPGIPCRAIFATTCTRNLIRTCESRFPALHSSHA